MYAWCAGKTVRSLENACHRGAFTTRRYANPRLPLPLPLLLLLLLSRCVLFQHWCHGRTITSMLDAPSPARSWLCWSTISLICAELSFAARLEVPPSSSSSSSSRISLTSWCSCGLSASTCKSTDWLIGWLINRFVYIPDFYLQLLPLLLL